MTMERAGIYIHIPFCRAKCAYCDFSSYPGLQDLHAPYVEALIQEIRQRQPAWADVPFDTLFIGGGTPTLLPAAALVRLREACHHELGLSATAESSVEANPGTVSRAALAALREAGFTRLSLGVQSLRADELALLGRIHTPHEARVAYRWAREAGFANLNLDLMLGLPGQTLPHWRETLTEALAWGSEHLALYALTVEAGTPLAERIACGGCPPPDDERAAEMYELAEELLAQAGYVHYEISNWARAPYVGQHNLKYWHNARYLGLGAAAHSYDGRRRSANVTHPQEYIARLAAGAETLATSETLTRVQQMGETLMLGLRLIAGLAWAEFEVRFGVNPRAVYGPEIEALVADGLLETDDQGLRLTRRGRLLGNRVFAAFLREEEE